MGVFEVLSAFTDGDGEPVDVTFSQDLDISSIGAEVVTVHDTANSKRWSTSAATMPAANMLRFACVESDIEIAHAQVCDWLPTRPITSVFGAVLPAGTWPLSYN